MAESLSVEVDDKAFLAAMKGLERSIPFALSYAINQTAKVAVKDLRTDAKKTFTIRGNQWVPKGLQMRGATKHTLTAEVGSVDPFMEQHIDGGTKKAQSGRMGIPLTGKGRARARKRSVTLPKDWPRALAAKDPDVFVGTAGKLYKGGKKKRRKNRALNTSRAGGTYAVWRRMPKHRLRMVYAFKEQVSIPARWQLQRIVKQAVDANWPTQVERAIKYAIDHARK
jgi:hypothetical protein